MYCLSFIIHQFFWGFLFLYRDVYMSPCGNHVHVYHSMNKINFLICSAFLKHVWWYNSYIFSQKIIVISIQIIKAGYSFWAHCNLQWYIKVRTIFRCGGVTHIAIFSFQPITCLPKICDTASNLLTTILKNLKISPGKSDHS